MRIVGSDPSGVPMVHPFRAPGTWHRKKEPRMCQLVALHPEREIDLDEALEVLRAAAPDKKKSNREKSRDKKNNKSGGDETDKSASGLFFGQCATWFEQGRSIDEIEREFAEHPKRYAETILSRYVEEGRLRKQIEECQKKWREHHAEYQVHDGGIWWMGGEFDTRLTNWSAEISEEIKLDDGSGVTQRQFVIDGSLGRAEIAAAEFDAMKWVSREWGARARIIPGSYHHQRVADAIKALSSAARRTVYVHFGWRRIGGEWVYLHAGGGIGADGAVDTVEVKSDNALAQVVLPPVSDLRRAVRASLDLLNVAPEQITYPLWGAIYRAPLGEFAPVTVVPWLFGPTGVLKTSLALLAQAHYAPMLGSRPITNWASTANNNEKLAFLAKDVLLLVDDFCPRGSATDVARMHAAADRLLRAAANRSGRGRMNADLSLRPEMYACGLLLGTGEELPRGHSLRARIVVLEVAADEVDVEKLTELQQQTPLLGEAMSGYVSWLAKQDKKQFAARQNELRAEGHGGGHLRTPENFASLQLGVETGLRFAVECGALSEREAREHEERAWRIMQRLAGAQNSMLRSESPANRFVRLLGAVLSSGRGHVTTLDGGEPKSSSLLGWRESGADRGTRSAGSPRTSSISIPTPPTRKCKRWHAAIGVDRTHARDVVETPR